MNVEYDGIVLRQVLYKEKDSIVTILTKDGLISFNARGIASTTSKNASSCILFAYSKFLLSDKNNKYSLKQGTIIESNYELYSSLEAMSAMQVALEAILRFCDEKNNDIFDYLYNFIMNLKQGFDSRTLLVILLAQLIKESGYALEYSSCVSCGSKENIVSINYSKGGFICRHCASKSDNNINLKDYLNSYRYAFMVTPELMNHYSLDKIISLRLINEFINHLCASFDIKDIKSLEIYKNSID